VVASTTHGPNSTPISLVNTSGVADITQCVTSTVAATQQQLMITPTDMLGESSHSTPASGGPSQTDSTSRGVSSIALVIASTPTPLCGLEIQSAHIPNPVGSLKITNPLRIRATEENQSEKQWQL